MTLDEYLDEQLLMMRQQILKADEGRRRVFVFNCLPKPLHERYPEWFSGSHDAINRIAYKLLGGK